MPVKAVLKYKKRIGKCVNKEGGVDGRTLSETWPRFVFVLLVFGFVLILKTFEQVCQNKPPESDIQ